MSKVTRLLAGLALIGLALVPRIVDRSAATPVLDVG